METFIKQLKVTRFDDKGNISVLEDYIVDEDILEIVIDGNRSFEMVFSNSYPEELAAGFLFTQGIIEHKNDLKKITFREDLKQCLIELNPESKQRLDYFRQQGQVKGSSGGSLLGRMPGHRSKQDSSNQEKNQEFSVAPEKILNLIEMHQDYSGAFKKTGAVHSAGLCDQETILSYYEDIGRHNALDKMAGDILLKEIDTARKIATLSCRISLEIAGKLIKTGIPVAITNAAPTMPAVRLAEKSGLTVVGFARNSRFNVYTHTQRIQIQNKPESII